MHKDWPEMANELNGIIKEVRLGTPEVMKAFSAMAQAATAGGAIDAKTKELIAIAIAVAIRCDGCVAFHAKAAVKLGATREEIMETMGMALRSQPDVCRPGGGSLRPVLRRGCYLKIRPPLRRFLPRRLPAGGLPRP